MNYSCFLSAVIQLDNVFKLTASGDLKFKMLLWKARVLSEMFS